MERLVVVRSGKNNYSGPNPNLRLTVEGQSRMQLLGKQLSRILPKEGLEIFSSPLPYARESAFVLEDVFGISHAVHDFLLVDPEYWMQKIDEIISFILAHAQNGTRTLVLVTHHDYAQEILPRMLWVKFGREIERLKLDYAEAAIFDWESGSIETVSPYDWRIG